MKFNIWLFLGQCVIFYNKHEFVNAKAMIGHNIRQARSGEFPFIISIMRINPGQPQSSGEHFCTGVLITRKDVLTAAHCLEDEIANTIQLVIGHADLRMGEKFYPEWWITHDQWAIRVNITIDFNLNDIANIRLILEVPSHLRTVKLTSLSNIELYGKKVVIAGWGISNANITPNIMEVSNVEILPNHICERRAERLIHAAVSLNIRLLCTAVTPHVLLEMGDSGGPLLHRNKLIAINKGVCPTMDTPVLTEQVNIHLGIHYYRYFINYMVHW